PPPVGRHPAAGGCNLGGGAGAARGSERGGDRPEGVADAGAHVDDALPPCALASATRRSRSSLAACVGLATYAAAVLPNWRWTSFISSSSGRRRRRHSRTFESSIARSRW